MSHLQPAHLHAIFMEIFSAGEQAVSDNELGADTADFTAAILAGTLGADKLVVHCDNLAVDDGLTEGTPTEQSIRREKMVRAASPHTVNVIDLVCGGAGGPDLDPVTVYDVATESTAGTGGLLWSAEHQHLQSLPAQTYLVAVLAERLALVDVELEAEDDSAGLAAETVPVVSSAPGGHSGRTHRLEAVEAGT